MKRLEGGYLGNRPSWSLASNPGIWAIEQVYARRAAGTWPVGAGSFDEYYEYVSLLLHMNGSNASTQFVDSSLRNLNITAVSSNITTSQSKFGGASGNFVRSSGGRLNIPATAGEFVFGAGDFTIEAWIYLNSMPSTGYPGSFWICGWGGANSNSGFDFYLTNTSIVLNLTDFGSITATGAHGINTGQWYHIAAARSGSSIKLFVNGQEKASGTSTADALVPSAGSAIAISAAEPTGGATGGNVDGFIDELRITKGYCRYLSNFNPQTVQFEDEGAPLVDPFYNYVSLLLPMNGSNNSTTFTDKSLGARVVTPSGDAKLSTADKRYGVSSAYFDGTGDYLTIADTSSGFSFGTGDFTYEWWFKSNATNNYAAMLTRPYSAAGGILISLNGATGDGAPEVYWREWTNGLFFKSSVTGLNDNKWHHFAFVRSGTTVYMFIDGVQAASKTSVSTSVGSSSVIIGQDIEYAGRTYTGYIDDLRITKGVARYVANFIPPLTHADYGTLADPYLGASTLWVPMEGQSSSTGFFDRAGRIPISTYGNAKLTNLQYKWGAASALFDGSADYLQANSQPAFGTGDFTIEFWVLPNSTTGIQGYIDFRPGQGAYPCVYQNGGTLNYYVNTGDRISGTNVLTIGRWHHVAVARRGTATKMFCNGVQVGSTYTDSTSYLAPTLRIGCTFDAYCANAYFDDVRITNGVALYTDNFSLSTFAINDQNRNDPYLSNISLLLKMDGANNSTTFTDSSLTPKGVLANGDAKISTTQSKFGGSSALFDGNGDFLRITPQPLVGTEAFTIEAWIYITSSPNYGTIFGSRTTNTGFSCGIDTSRNLVAYSHTSGVLSTTGTAPLNSWAHVAYSYTGTQFYMFLNGAQVYSGTVTITQGDYGIIGTNNGNGGTEYFNGYIDDLRITKGVARYTANFLPPTISHPVWSETDANFSSVSLLLNGNGANASTVLADRSSNGLTLVPNGNAQISTTQSRFGGSSLYFDGTGDYLSTNYNSALEFGTGDFTIEFWANLADLTYRFFLGGPLNSGGYLFMAINPTGAGQIWVGRSGTDWPLQFSSHSIQANTWVHIAVSRSGTSNYCFVNGIQIGSTITNSTNWLINPSGFWIGGQTGGSSLNGYIDDLRITKGVARYTAAFTPPVAPHPISVIDANFSAVSLLLHMNGANASTYFPDHSYNALAVTANGNAQISTAQSKFGGASALFDGSGDYLDISVSASPTGSEAFTIEAWIYPTAVTGQDRVIFETRGGTGFVFFINTSGYLQVFDSTANLLTASTALLVANTWQHIALSKSGSTASYYVNGISAGTYTLASHATATSCRIGARNDAAAAFVGYIDDLRITRGVARYTANFTPPTTQFPNS
jgi:hypothetical protein